MYLPFKWGDFIKRTLILAFLLIFFICIASYFFLIPHNIVRHINSDSYIFCELYDTYYLDGRAETNKINIELSDDDKSLILTCLRSYQCVPTPIRSDICIFLSDVKFKLSVGSREIYINKNGDCFFFCFNDFPFLRDYALQYHIIGGSSMKSEIEGILRQND